MFFSSVISIFASVMAVKAAEFTVKVGANNALVFDPPQITQVQNGDTINFQFQSKNHTVTQSSFATPCTALPRGVDSGFMFVPPGAATLPQWSITIQNASAPLWFYCKQKAPANHCTAGMVFAINPTAEKTFDTFLAAAKATGPGAGGNPSGAPSAVTSAPTASATGRPLSTVRIPTDPSASASPSGTADSAGTSDTAAPSLPTGAALKVGGTTGGIATALAILLGLML